MLGGTLAASAASSSQLSSHSSSTPSTVSGQNQEGVGISQPSLQCPWHPACCDQCWHHWQRCRWSLPVHI
ncbi:Uncharacterised protein [Chlamydia abortus]|nr:Uncharacterised protein [Chlamydia abortus]